MKVLVIGSGGREHAIIKKIKDNKSISHIYAIPGNGGIAQIATCVDIGAKQIDKIVDFAVDNNIDYVIVTPDDPLVLGLVDLLEEKGIPCFGPNKRAAIIEGSKAFAKELMKKANIPTASYDIFNDTSAALKYIDNISFPVVIKADGLALGKGVIIAETKSDAIDAINSIMEDKVFGDSGNQIVIEEFLTGPEVSVLTFTDGKTLIPMVSSMDHKRALDGDLGLNTGGMGVIAPNPYYTSEISDYCYNNIFIPTIEAMNSQDRTFCGCLYFGLMLTPNGPKVIEYNCRFGDPETQAVLPLLESDLFDIMKHVTYKTLHEAEVVFSEESTCTVVVASEGYPSDYKKGFRIDVKDMTHIDIAGAVLDAENLVTNGGRVLALTHRGIDLKAAIDNTYANLDNVKFDNAYYRRDIGQKALEALEK